MNYRKSMTSFECDKCGHKSLVRSNFRLTPQGKAFCKSSKRPKCEEARQDEIGWEKPYIHVYNPGEMINVSSR